MMREKGKKGGFILVLIVSLAGIIALLGAALVSITRVESTSIEYKTHVSMARDNARTALDLALGDLQMYAGRDQTVTALADGYRSPANEDFTTNAKPVDSGGGRIYQPFWTGVWDNNPTTKENPEWLVTRPLRTNSDFDPGTGTLASPFVDPNGNIDYVTLVGASTAEFVPGAGTQNDFNVSVPLETVESVSVLGTAGNSMIGKYGYWVGDLGVKGSYLVPYRWNDIDHDRFDTLSESNLGTRTRLKQMVGQTQLLDEILPELEPNLSRFKKVVSNFQLRKDFASETFIKKFVDLDPDKMQNFTLLRIRRAFYDYTAISRGVLINSLDGGLKDDLTPLELTGDSDTIVDDQILSHVNLGSSLASGPDPLRREYAAVEKSTNSGGASYDGLPRIGPVVTEFNINFAVYLNRTGADLNGRIRYNGDVEIWNPYTSSLSDPNDGSFSVEVTDLPVVDMRYQATGNPLNESSTDLDDRIPANAFSLSMATELRPGQVRLYSGGSLMSIDVEDSGSTTIDVSTDISFTDPTPTDPTDDTFSFRVRETCQPVLIVRNSLGAEIGRYTIDASYDSFPDGVFQVASIDDTTPTFGYTWERKDPIFGSEDWTDFDPRVETIASAGEVYAFDSDPRSAVNYSHTVQDSTNRILGYRSPADVSYDVPLLELPRQELVSIAELQHADLGTGFPRQIGRSIDSLSGETNYNRMFDQYFFSTIPQSSTSTWSLGGPLANARMCPMMGEPLSSLQASGKDSAQHLFVEGAFNVNSTSIAAWTAVLKSIRLKDWDYYDSASGIASTESFGTESQFFFYSQSAEEVWDVNANLDTRESFRRGLRTFSNAEIVSLATKIVEQVRVKIDDSGPFGNLKEFVDSEILDTAINGAGLNSSPANIVPNSPQWMLQGTLLNSLAPFLTTRSDTFLIRAYGDSRNPSDQNKIVARAYCEAVVQRLPDKHTSDPAVITNPSNPDQMSPTGTGDGEFGRQFEVIAFRWMTGEEI